MTWRGFDVTNLWLGGIHQGAGERREIEYGDRRVDCCRRLRRQVLGRREAWEKGEGLLKKKRSREGSHRL
jgi:hypothetical protein